MKKRLKEAAKFPLVIYSSALILLITMPYMICLVIKKCLTMTFCKECRTYGCAYDRDQHSDDWKLERKRIWSLLAEACKVILTPFVLFLFSPLLIALYTCDCLWGRECPECHEYNCALDPNET